MNTYDGFKTYLYDAQKSNYRNITRLDLDKALLYAVNQGWIENTFRFIILNEYDIAHNLIPTKEPDTVIRDVITVEAEPLPKTQVIETDPMIITINQLQADNWEGMSESDIMRLLKTMLDRGLISNAEYLSYLNDYRASFIQESEVIDEVKVIKDGTVYVTDTPGTSDPGDLAGSAEETPVNYAVGTDIPYTGGELTPPPLGSPMTAYFTMLSQWIQNGWDQATPALVYDVLNRLVALQIITVHQYSSLLENYQANFANNMAGVSVMLNKILVDAMNHGMQNMTRVELSNKLDELIRYRVIDSDNAEGILDAWDSVHEWATGTLGSGYKFDLKLIAVLSAIFSYFLYKYPTLLPAMAQIVSGVFWIMLFGTGAGLVAYTGYKLYSNYKGNFGKAISQTFIDIFSVIKDLIVDLFTELFPMLLSMFGSIAGDSLLDNVAGVIDTAIGIGNTIGDEIKYEEYTKQIITACYLFMEKFPVTPTISEVNDSINQTLALAADNTSDTPAADFFDKYI
jgi:hypothetical protein